MMFWGQYGHEHAVTQTSKVCRNSWIVEIYGVPRENGRPIACHRWRVMDAKPRTGDSWVRKRQMTLTLKRKGKTIESVAMLGPGLSPQQARRAFVQSLMRKAAQHKIPPHSPQ